MRISAMHPTLYRMSVSGHRLKRRALWFARGHRIATEFDPVSLPVRMVQHQSPLLRKLGDADMQLQLNKVTNLAIAAKAIDGVIIRPGDTFSFWKLVGEPSAERGFLEGMLISDGKVMSGVGGGLCQMANLLYWMFLHTQIDVTERHHHSMDLFPDSGRTIPFGTGATIFYNYVDLQCVNHTAQTFQIRTWIEGGYLKGEIRSDRDCPVRFSIVEQDHAYLRKRSDGKHYRTNEIYRHLRATDTGQPLREEFLMENFSVMKYAPPEGASIREIE